jgi:spore coat protein CotH
MIATQFGNKLGNIYKPESHFSQFDSTEFEKKNNKKLADWRDVQSLIHVLNNEIRTRNPRLWRQQLDAIFNVKAYLKWLALNSVMVNWDTYGRMAHNFYLYNDPKEKLTWIPWDNNEALKDGMGMKPPQGMPFPPKIDSSFSKASGMPFPPPMMGNRGDAGDLRHLKVTNEWPLIRYLLDDAVYQKVYKQAIKQVSEKVFTQQYMSALLQDNYRLLKPYVEQEQLPYSHLKSKDDFEKAFQELNTHIQKRMDAAKKYMSTP